VDTLPIDFGHLDRQTGGDEILRDDVLRMFADRAAADMAALRAAIGAVRREIAHRIVGSARAIGADEVARLAAEVEAGGDNLEALAAALDAAVGFISAHLAGAGRTGRGERNRL
jgi:HPt (histidine-containing phosphotransfer) domain-containing protein